MTNYARFHWTLVGATLCNTLIALGRRSGWFFFDCVLVALLVINARWVGA